jgi:hypothetical protein
MEENNSMTEEGDSHGVKYKEVEREVHSLKPSHAQSSSNSDVKEEGQWPFFTPVYFSSSSQVSSCFTFYKKCSFSNNVA